MTDQEMHDLLFGTEAEWDALRARAAEARKSRCPMSGQRSSRTGKVGQCEECGRTLRADRDGRWPEHKLMSRRPPGTV